MPQPDAAAKKASVVNTGFFVFFHPSQTWHEKRQAPCGACLEKSKTAY
jgi:hypothetical protein